MVFSLRLLDRIDWTYPKPYTALLYTGFLPRGKLYKGSKTSRHSYSHHSCLINHIAFHRVPLRLFGPNRPTWIPHVAPHVLSELTVCQLYRTVH